MRAALLVLFGVHFVFNMTRPLLSLYASSLGAGALEIGLVASAYALLPLVLAMRLGRLADAMGEKLPGVMGAAGVVVGMSLPFLFPSMEALYLSQIIIGVSHTLCLIALQSVVGHASTDGARDRNFGMLAMAASLGGLVGPVVGGYVSEYWSYRSAFLVASLVGVVPVAFATLLPSLPRRSRSRPVTTEPGGSLGLLKIPALRYAVAISALVVFTRDIFIIYFPLLAKQAGVAESTIGWIIAVQGLAIVVVRLFLGRLTLALGRERVLLASILIAGVAFTLVPFVSQIALLGLLSVLMGLGLGCGQPISIATTYGASPKNKTGEALGLRLAVSRLSQFIAPLLLGAIAAWIGLLSVFYISGACLVGGAFVLRRGDDYIGNAR